MGEELDGRHGPIAHEAARRRDQLQGLVKTVDLDPATIANGAVGLLNEVSTSKITGEEDRYSHTDLWDFEANVVGSQAGVDAARRRRARSPTWRDDRQRLRRRPGRARAVPEGDGYVAYTTLTTADTRTLRS